MADHEKFSRAVQVVARALAKVARERARNGTVTVQQAETLQLLAERGSSSTSSLAVSLAIDPSTASRNLAGLERAGLVARKRGTKDGRQTEIRLTAKGRRTADAFSAALGHAYGTIYDKLPRAERQKVLEAMDSLARMFSGPVKRGQ